MADDAARLKAVRQAVGDGFEIIAGERRWRAAQKARLHMIPALVRDLTDSTVLRNIGVAFGYAVLAYASLATGLGKLELNEEALAEDLEASWEVLAEPIQTVMRRFGVQGAYEQLKEVTRGKTVTAEALHELIRSLEIPAAEKERLLAMTPGSYTGKAAELARRAQTP